MEKVIRLQDAKFKLKPSGSNETSIFLDKDIKHHLDLRDGQQSTFKINKDNILKSLSFTYSFNKKIFQKEREIVLNNDWFEKERKKIEVHFGTEVDAEYTVDIIEQTEGRLYIKKLRQEVSGFNVRDILIEGHFKLDLTKSRLQLFYCNDPYTENSDNIEEGASPLSEFQDEFEKDKFYQDIKVSGLNLSYSLIQRFITSLQTKRFVILTGLSGSGKTKLAEAYSSWICEFDKQVCMVAVGADWTNRESLLGYPNALSKDEYVRPESRVLDLILNAQDDSKNPYFLILDEMNMSHVERYFADFLSAMESVNSTISLHSGDKEWNGVPSQVTLPKNLFIIGTVNVDETTYMFSPKVLDRANVIEFRVSKNEMNDYLNYSINLEMKNLNGKGAHMAQDFVSIALSKAGKVEGLSDKLMPFFNNLQIVGAEFGYRSASEISRFVSMYNINNGIINEDEAVDAAIAQKLLPKLHGSRNKLEKTLIVLAKQCLNSEYEDEVFPEGAIGDAKYPISYEKLERMHKRIMSDGFTSFAEA